MLYSFEKLRKLLDEIAPTKDSLRKKYLVVEGETIDIKKIKDKEVLFEDDGIYAIFNGEKFRRYLYMPNYRVAHYENTFPVAHLIKCTKVTEIGRGYYVLGSKSSVDVIDRDTGKLYKAKVLAICSYCLTEIITDNSIPESTEDFFNNLIAKEIENKDLPKETDVFGYTLTPPFDWDTVSRKYRESKNYTCEQCAIQITDTQDYRFLHVHHKDGNKQHNHPKNLQCLCVLCHSKVDDHHADNFDKPRMKHQVDSFVAKYGKKDK